MNILLLLLLNVSILLSAELSFISKVKDENSWHIHLMVTPKQDINKIVLTYNGLDINQSTVVSPNKKLSTTIMFLVDTSLPMKKEFNQGIKSSIIDIFSLKNSWDKWAVSGFSDEMKIFGNYNQTEPSAALNNIVVSGQRTELFRASLEAIESLKAEDGKRKFLFLFSDGDAEDNAYTYQEVITKANDANVTIVSFGYKDSIHLQNLRRISEETGGKLYFADKRTYQLESGYKKDLHNLLNNDFEVSFNSDVLQGNMQGEVNVDLKVYFDNNSSLSQNIILDVEKLLPGKVKNKNYLLYYILAGAIVLIVLFFIFKPKKEEPEEETEEAQAPKPIAYFQSASGAKQYIYKTHTSIGAMADNDLVIDGEYISRYHATLDLKDGKFFLIDNNSANKVFINYKEISSSMVKDGDVVAFGPYEVTFRIV